MMIARASAWKNSTTRRCRSVLARFDERSAHHDALLRPRMI
jgi:hypothetical protein